MVDLGTLPGYASSEATGINSKGDVVGLVYKDEYAGYYDRRAFLYKDGTMTDLGGLPGYPRSCAYGINSAGQVVGTAYVGDFGESRAFLYSDGAMIDLSSLIDPALGWTIFEARGINDSGWIVGTMGSYAALLTPIPEPSTLVLLSTGAISLLAYAWRRRKRTA